MCANKGQPFIELSELGSREGLREREGQGWFGFGSNFKYHFRFRCHRNRSGNLRLSIGETLSLTKHNSLTKTENSLSLGGQALDVGDFESGWL